MSKENLVRAFRQKNPGTIVTDVRARGNVFQVVFWSAAGNGFQEVTATPAESGYVFTTLA